MFTSVRRDTIKVEDAVIGINIAAAMEGCEMTGCGYSLQASLNYGTWTWIDWRGCCMEAEGRIEKKSAEGQEFGR